MRFAASLILALAAVILTACAAGNAPAPSDPGVTATTIKLGVVHNASASPGIALVAKQTSGGIKAFVEALNAAGGVNGRKLEVITYDDGGDAGRRATIRKRLVEQDQVFAILISGGGPTTLSSLPYFEEQKIPMISGNAALPAFTDPPKRYIFNLVTDYNAQGQLMTRYALDQLGARKIGYTGFADESGIAHLAAVKEAIQGTGAQVVGEFPWERGTQDFMPIVQRLRQSGADYVTAFASAGEFAQMLKSADQIGWNVIWGGAGAVSDPNTVKLLGPQLAPRAYTVTPFDLPDASTPGMQEFRQNLARYAPDMEPGTYTELGYAAARVFTEAARRVGKDLTREKLVDTLETMAPLDTGLAGPFQFGKGIRNGNNSVMVIRGKNAQEWERVTGWITLRR